MRALLQRVTQAQVLVDGEVIAAIQRGWAILLGVAREDDAEAARQLATRIAHLRLFDDAAGKMNLSALEVGAEILVVSQFTLFADTSRGRRPSFLGAAPPEQAEPLVEVFARELEALGLRVARGRFGARMLVQIYNDGPVTVALASPGDTWGG